MREIDFRKQRILTAIQSIRSERDGIADELENALTALRTIAALPGAIWSLLPEAVRTRLQKYRS